jgi:hypothetical protein
MDGNEESRSAGVPPSELEGPQGSGYMGETIAHDDALFREAPGGCQTLANLAAQSVVIAADETLG